MDTADIIFDLLDKKGETQQAFANAIGVTKNKVSEWKAKKTKSYKNYINEIAAYFNVTTDYLLGNEQKNKLPAEARSLSDIENEILSIFHTLPEDKRQAFITVARSLKSQSKDK
jgi:repressor LexA